MIVQLLDNYLMHNSDNINETLLRIVRFIVRRHSHLQCAAIVLRRYLNLIVSHGQSSKTPC
jgi:hypothetical protein